MDSPIMGTRHRGRRLPGWRRREASEMNYRGETEPWAKSGSSQLDVLQTLDLFAAYDRRSARETLPGGRRISQPARSPGCCTRWPVWLAGNHAIVESLAQNFVHGC